MSQAHLQEVTIKFQVILPADDSEQASIAVTSPKGETIHVPVEEGKDPVVAMANLSNGYFEQIAEFAEASQ